MKSQMHVFMLCCASGKADGPQYDRMASRLVGSWVLAGCALPAAQQQLFRGRHRAR